jgi:hypothetical protein
MVTVVAVSAVGGPAVAPAAERPAVVGTAVFRPAHTVEPRRPVRPDREWVPERALRGCG